MTRPVSKSSNCFVASGCSSAAITDTYAERRSSPRASRQPDAEGGVGGEDADVEERVAVDDVVVVVEERIAEEDVVVVVDVVEGSQ